MAKKFTFDDAITTDIKGAASNSYIVSTHVDKEHLHNHIIVNSCNMITGRKYYDNKETMKNNRAIAKY